ncbi:uncharacterized protein LOC108598078 [Drosophila busckii]|uniref:uncharacterized protein LOC108598078 n=1 Tax=Drosophila busckii TaxID=30019 RepID=UPI00083EB4FA|nr:uncharacterized protein LOC108598078 [Drosophila busckii]
MALFYTNLTLLASSFVSQTIKELNILYGMELNAYIELSERSLVEQYLPVQQPALPTLRMSNKSPALVLSGNFSEHALTIIYLEDEHRSRIFSYLTNWLWRAQQLHVLFIYPQATEVALYELFAHCWRQGMVHILVLLPQSQQLISYMPYPQLGLLRMQNTTQYFKRTRDLLWNFHGFVITCGILPNAPPRAFLFRDQRQRLVYAGYMLRMVLDFIAHFNGSINTRTLDTLAQANEALRLRLVDFLPNLLPSSEHYTGSVMLWHEKNYLLAPAARLLPRYKYLVRPFGWSSWLALLLTLFYCSSALWLLCRPQLQLSSALLQILRLLLFLSAGSHWLTPPAARRLLLYVLMTVTGLVFTNLYLAQLSSILAAGIYDKQLHSFGDLAGTSYVLPLEQSSYDFLRQLPQLHAELLQRLQPTPDLLVDSYRNALNTSILHSGFEDTIEFVFYQQKFLRVPRLQKLSQMIYQQPFFMPAAFGRPYLKIFNAYVRRMFEAGILLKMKSDGFTHGIQSGRLHFVSSSWYQEVNSNDLEYYYIAGLLWLAGMLLAGISFVCELCWTQSLLINVAQ